MDGQMRADTGFWNTIWCGEWFDFMFDMRCKYYKIQGGHVFADSNFHSKRSGDSVKPQELQTKICTLDNFPLLFTYSLHGRQYHHSFGHFVFGHILCKS